MITKRLAELLQLCEQSEPDDYDYTQGYFDSNLTYHWYREYPEDTLFVWEWVLYPEIVQYAESLGITIPEEPPIDLSKTF
ncbi:MAG: hypothetical protein II873_04080 [Oscillospiraceae bacterium]|nr:hypothetical protein [Oscillospiraceae bacterium]